MKEGSIFISHIYEEKKLAILVKESLEKHFLNVFNVFVSSHPESLQLGDSWLDTIKKSVMDCKLMIVICSPASVKRPWINFEAGAGWIKEIPVIPLCHSGLTLDKLPVPLNSFQGGSLSSEEDYRKLFSRVANLYEIDPPNIRDNDFFSIINTFESEAKLLAFSKGIGLMSGLLRRKIHTLKYCIHASTSSPEKLEESNVRRNIIEYNYTFNDIHNLFNCSDLKKHTYRQKRVYQVFYESVNALVEEIKFVLSYKDIRILPSFRSILHQIINASYMVDEWYEAILDDHHSLEQKNTLEERIEQIKNYPEKYPHANGDRKGIISLYINYYYPSLNKFRSLIHRYEQESDSFNSIRGKFE